MDTQRLIQQFQTAQGIHFHKDRQLNRIYSRSSTAVMRTDRGGLLCQALPKVHTGAAEAVLMSEDNLSSL